MGKIMSFGVGPGEMGLSGKKEEPGRPPESRAPGILGKPFSPRERRRIKEATGRDVRDSRELKRLLQEKGWTTGWE